MGAVHEEVLKNYPELPASSVKSASDERSQCKRFRTDMYKAAGLKPSLLDVSRFATYITYRHRCHKQAI